MLGPNDYKKSRFYQEAVKEGRREQLRESVRQMASSGCDAERISFLLETHIRVVNKLLKS